MPAQEYFHEYENMGVKFDAVLKTVAGKTIEMGRGVFSAENHSVDFESSFVPLFSMGTRLQVFRIHEGAEVHRFEGEVYLSSPHMLRLVEVKDEILPGAALAFLYYVDLDGTGHAIIKKQERHLFKTRTVETPIDFAVRVHALSVREIKFNVNLNIELSPGQPLTLRLPGGPRIQNLPVLVRQAIVFGTEANCYRCQIRRLPPDSQRRLQEYVKGLSLAAIQQPNL